MRRPLYSLLLILLFVIPFHATDVFQKTAPNWPNNYPVSGSVNVQNFPSTQTVTVTNFPPAQPIQVSNFPSTQNVSISGVVTVSSHTVSVSNFPAPISTITVNNSPIKSGTSIVNRVSVSNSLSVVLSTSNLNRIKTIVWNESGNLYVKFGSAASETSYTYRMTANTPLEVTNYLGVISAIKASGTSDVMVTEIQ